MKKKFVEEKGSMAVYVTIVLLAFMIILSAIYASAIATRKEELGTIVKIKEAYEMYNDDIKEAYEEVYDRFYFDVELEKDYVELDINKEEINLNIKNYISEDKYNNYDVNYQISLESNIESNNKFEIQINDENSGTITSGIKENDINIILTPIEGSIIELEEKILLKVKSTSPYKREIDFEIKVINSSTLIGRNIEYNISYVDMFSEYEFTSNEGWRILDTGKLNSDGSYSNAKIITTGVPAKLYYNSSTYSNWWGNAEEVNKEYGLNLTEWQSSKSRYFAAYGLKYNFTSVTFSDTNNSKKNTGFYNKITNTEATSSTIGEIFLTSKAKSVHVLTLEELNMALNKVQNEKNREEKSLINVTSENDTQALFYLRALNKYSYSTSTVAPYWLATPNDDNTGLVRVQAAGTYAGGTDSTYGIRPVITLKSNIFKQDGIWKIQ